MQEEGWRPCARERGRNLPPDQAGFAHSGDGDAAPASEEDVDGFCEGGIKPGFDLLDGAGFDCQHSARGFQAHRSLRIIITLSQLRRSNACLLQAGCAPTNSAGRFMIFPNAAPATTILSGGTTNRLIAVAARHSLRPKGRLADCRASPRRSRLLRQLWRRGPAAR